MIRISTLFFITILMSTSVFAQQELNDLFERHEFTNKDGEVLRYRLLNPDQTTDQDTYPLVLFMHGAGQRGTDNEQQLVHGAWNFALPENRAEYPAFVIAPQVPGEQKWSTLDWWGPTDQVWGDSLSPVMELTIQLVEQFIEKHPVDVSRIYVTGLSMGGFGTWEFIQRKPEWVAAAVPVCGGGDLTKADRITGIPIWSFHGDKDYVVKTDFSRLMHQTIKEMGGNSRYTELKGVDHNAWDTTYANQDMIRWMFSQKQGK
ncbi:MAG: PHB depolymerase family esterase [Bacteroidota bacterium]